MKKLLLSTCVLFAFCGISFGEEMKVFVYKEKGNYEVIVNEVRGIISKKNKVIVPFKYEYIKKLDKENYLVSKDDKYGIFNKEKGEIIPCENWYVNKIAKDYFLVSYQEKIRSEGLISKDGKVILEPIYNLIWEDENNSFKVIKGKEYKMGYVENDKMVIPCEYDYVVKLNKGIYLAVNNEKVGVLSSENEVIIPFEYKRIKKIIGNYYLATSENGKKIIKIKR